MVFRLDSFHRPQFEFWFGTVSVDWIVSNKKREEMAPKDDPETAALKKELADLIAKFQVKFWKYILLIFL